MHKSLFTILLTSLLMVSGLTAYAQESTARAEISTIQNDGFPTIRALLDVYDSRGQFISGLDAGRVTILENGQPRPLDGLNEQDVGVQLVVAINPGPPMSTRNALGVSRYEQVVDALRAWAEARPVENLDDMNLVATAGPLITHASPSEWRNSLVSFQPDVRAAIPSLQSLSFALDLAEAETTQAGMKRSILFLTPHLPDQATVNALETLTQRAVLSGVRVNVWLIDSENYFFDISANALKSMALQTNGNYFAFSGEETIPDPDTYFAHLRRVYALNYTSQIRISGNHIMAAQVALGEAPILSQNEAFELTVEPPNPILLSPPPQILRQPPADNPYNTEILLPDSLLFEMIVEFPDGHERPLTRTALLVDGKIVAENVSAPFEGFTWDLSEFTLSGEYSLQVEVEDSLGLYKISMGIPINVTIVQPPTGIMAFFGRNSAILTIGVIALAGILLAAILLVGSRRGVFSFAARRKEHAANHDPLTQPIPVQVDVPSNKKRNTQERWARKPKKVSASAYLVRLNGDNQSATDKPIPLTDEEMTFGSDPVKATYVLDDPSVSPLHARLRQSEENTFTIADQGSVAGTWINMQSIDRTGKELRHGDVIHIGQLRYRFELEKPPQISQPKITPEVRQ